MQGERREVFINCVDNLREEGLDQGAPGLEYEVDKVAARAYLPLHGQGPDKDP